MHTHILSGGDTLRERCGGGGGMRLPGDPAALGKESMPSVRSWPCAGCDISKIAVWVANKLCLRVIHVGMLCQ